jgi:hypothetical protein
MGWWDEARKDWMHDAAYPIRARGQRHRDAPLSRRARILWRAVYGLLIVIIAVLVTLAAIEAI